MMSAKKIAIFIIDGAADRHLSQLKGKTPLQAAKTPNLDYFAEISSCGSLVPRPDYLGASTDLTHFLFFGYSEEDYPGRSILELLAMGRNPKPDCVYLSCLLASFELYERGLKLIRENISFTEEETAELFKAAGDFYSGYYRLKTYHQKGRYGILEIKGPHEELPLDTDPFKDDLYIGNPVSDGLQYRDKKLAEVLRNYLKNVYEKLDRHPINIERREKGLQPLNILVTKWPSKYKELRSFFELTGMKGAVIASSMLFKGMAKLLELMFIRNEETSIARKLNFAVNKAEELLESDYDFVLVHLKDTDEASHLKKPELKVSTLEEIDKGFESLLKSELLNPEKYVVAITADHPTPSTGNLIHSGEKTPLAIFSGYAGSDDVKAFNEDACAKGRLGTILSAQLLPLLMNFADRIAYSGSRITEYKILGFHDNERINPLNF